MQTVVNNGLNERYSIKPLEHVSNDKTKLRYRQPKNYDGIHADVDYDGYNTVLPYGDFSNVLKVRVRPVGSDAARLTVAFVTTRRRDGHRSLFVCGTDGKIHKYSGKFPQTKHVKIPVLANLLGISREYEITIDRPRVTVHMGDFSEFQGKGKPHACKPRRR